MTNVTAKKKLTMQGKLALKGFFFVLPALLFFTVFVLVPILMAMVLAFTSYDGIGEITFVGVQNFINIFTLDSIFGKSFLNVAWYALFAIPLSVILPLLYALLINTKVKGNKVFRAIYYLPGLTSAVAAATVFRLVFNPDIGIVNSFLRVFGIEGPQWLESSKTVKTHDCHSRHVAGNRRKYDYLCRGPQRHFSRIVRGRDHRRCEQGAHVFQDNAASAAPDYLLYRDHEHHRRIPAL